MYILSNNLPWFRIYKKVAAWPTVQSKQIWTSADDL